MVEEEPIKFEAFKAARQMALKNNGYSKEFIEKFGLDKEDTDEDPIKNELQKIEEIHGVKILFAVENGSRAWGMDSPDSDYDVRFVFVRSLRDYLKINKPKEVMEHKPSDTFDFVGFDIYKFASLLSKSNPSMIEWLLSDIVYMGEKNDVFVKFATKHYNPIALYHHYKSMCKQNYLKYIKSGNNTSYKKYLYSMRGLINAMIVSHRKELPPIKFTEAVEIAPLETRVYNKLKEIIKLKKESNEKEETNRIEILENFIESFLKKEEIVKNHKANTRMLEDEVINLVLTENEEV